MTLHDQEAGHDRSGEEEQGGPWTQDTLTALREAIKENHGPECGRGRSPEAAREMGPSLQHETEGWRTWQADLREAMQQSSLSDRVERGRIGAGGPAVSQGPPSYPPPLGDWMLEEGTQAGDEGFSGYGGESAPSSLPLTRVRQDAEVEDQETPYSMDTTAWEGYEGWDEPLRWPGTSDWQQERSSSSSSWPGAETRRATGGGTPAAHRREELALLGETRRQAVRFLGR